MNDQNVKKRQTIWPPAQWLRNYQRGWLKADVVAGVTLAAYAIPVSLAYATLAGLPPHCGIYCYLLGGVAYAMFDTSRRQLAIGPTSAIAMLVGTTIAGMAEGDLALWAGIASLTALVVAKISALAWLLRLSSLMSFISETILLGFKVGAALTIALTQLPKLFGVPGGGEHFFERLWILGGQLPAIQFPLLRLRDIDKVIPLAFACFLLSYIESVWAARTLAEACRVHCGASDRCDSSRRCRLGGGNAKKLKSLPHGCRMGDNALAFVGWSA